MKELLKEASSRLGFLKMVTPRGGQPGQGGRARVVYRDGKVLEGGEVRKRDRTVSNWDGGNMDPEKVAYHKKNLARAGFQNHQQVLGPYGF